MWVRGRNSIKVEDEEGGSEEWEMECCRNEGEFDFLEGVKEWEEVEA